MKKFAVLLALVCGVGAYAQAQGFMPWTDIVKMYDADGSGGVSMDESKNHKLGEDFVGFQPWMADHFAGLDTNADGEVTVEEIKAAMEGMKMTDSQLDEGFYKGFGFMPTNQ